MNLFKLIFQNFGFNALRTLGLKQYLYLIESFFQTISSIIKKKNLDILDEHFSNKIGILNVNFKGHRFKIDLKTSYNLANEGSFTFGLVRELYIKNCYFIYFDFKKKDIKNVVDLGGNRGVFSLLAANLAQNIIYVEPQIKYKKILEHNLRLNNFHNVTLINKFVGKNLNLEFDCDYISVKNILKNENINVIDFLKIDIEGSEFELFDTELLNKIKYIAMEIHPEYGTLEFLCKQFIEAGFKIKLTTMNFSVLKNLQTKNLIYLYGENRNI